MRGKVAQRCAIVRDCRQNRSVIAAGDLIVCSLGAAHGRDPRVGIWSTADNEMPKPLGQLSPKDRLFLAAISLPKELTLPAGRGVGERAVVASLSRPFVADAAYLDALDIQAHLRSRGRERIGKVLAERGLAVDEYLGETERARFPAPRVRSDVVEFLRAATDGRWDDARRLLVITGSDWWSPNEPPSSASNDAITREPVFVEAPAARRMLARAVEAALQDHPPTTGLSIEEDLEPPAAPEPSSDIASENPPARTGGRRPMPWRLVVPAVAVTAALLVVGVTLLPSKGGSVDSGSSVPKPPTTIIYKETAGGPADVHEDYKSLVGVDRNAIGAGDDVQVACRVRGVKVGPSDNPWWYLLASPRFRGRFVTADAFFNNGKASGDISHTPLVDKNVQSCK
jgi:hypothetical protein